METRKEKAVRLFKEGYNCSQSVFAAFSDLYDVDEKTALRIASSFGGGMGRMREVCGAVSGMFMVAGLENGSTEGKDSASKKDNYDLVVKLADEFKKENGSIICRDLLGVKTTIKDGKVDTTPTPRTDEYYKKRPCIDIVGNCAELVEKYIVKQSKKIKKPVKLVKVETSEHVTKVADLAEIIWKEYYEGILSDEQIEYMVDKYQSDNAITKQMVNEGYEYYLINKQSVIIGFVSFLRDESNKKIDLNSIYIIKEYRDMGYTRLAVECVEDICRESEFTSVGLTVNRRNTESISSYKRYGFVKVGETITNLGNGYTMDDLLMEKTVEE